MLLFLNKNKKNATVDLSPPKAALAPVLLQTPVAEFIPYYCHYNPHTVLTKNGELLQTIKIVANTKGLNYESGTDASNIVREVIRAAIMEHVKTDKVAIWLHTIRKRQSIRYRGKFKESLAAKVHERWQQAHRWKYQYYNEIYITVLHEGQSASLTDTDNFRNLIFFNRNRQFRNTYLDGISKTLDTMVTGMMESIGKTFVPHRLTVVERVPDPNDMKVGQAVFYSEMMEFLGTILNLRAEPVLLPQLDLSEALPTTTQTFGFNALETKTEQGKRRFAAILSLKQYREVPSETIDRLLQAPMEFIISQGFHFIPHTGALKQYKDQKDLFDFSGDVYCIGASGIQDMMSSQSEKPTDFGEHQTTVMVLCDELKQLDGEISKVQTAFAELGLITIREDIKLEEVFWSQLPGNFEFIRRKDTINTSRIGGFCRLNRYPQGLYAGNHWGDAVTIFTTLVGSPYFFNFHHQDNGHTLLLDFNSFNDQLSAILMNFLICESRKFDGRLCVFDRGRSTDLLFEKLGGDYHNFSKLAKDKERKQVQLNPFLMEDTPRNRGFILAWLGTLASPDGPLPEAMKDILRSGIEQLYEGDAAKRNLEALVDYVAGHDLKLSKAFDKWIGEGAYAGIFSTGAETLDVTKAMNGFDMNPVVKNADSLVPIFSYLLHRIITEIDGRPTIIVMHEAFDLLDNGFIAPRLESLMSMLQENNAMVIFTTSKPGRYVSLPIFATVNSLCATQMYLPDDVRQDYAAMPIGISDYDSRRLLRMDRQKGEFLVKQNNETIALKAEFKVMDEMYAVFANDRKNLAAALNPSADGSLG
jgi:type IV secretion system protein VirB4